MDTTETAPATALIIDDDMVFRERLARSLERRGWQVRRAASASEALEAASTAPAEMAILDLRLPDRSGLELLAPLRELLPEAFILILTGYGSIATAIQATRTGADHYLSKPVDVEQILSSFASFQGECSVPTPVEGGSVPSLGRVEWEHIQRVLADCGGNISQAAALLGIHRRSLQRKLAKDPPSR
jgi:two-component system, response regulator RegA